MISSDVPPIIVDAVRLHARQSRRDVLKQGDGGDEGCADDGNPGDHAIEEVLRCLPGRTPG